MPEFNIGKFHFAIGFGERQKTTAITPPKWQEWQERNASTWEKAQSDENVYAVRKPCGYNCGWWTMGISPKSRPDIANSDITIDYGRHLYHDCPNIPPAEKAKLTPRPKPSH